MHSCPRVKLSLPKSRVPRRPLRTRARNLINRVAWRLNLRRLVDDFSFISSGGQGR